VRDLTPPAIYRLAGRLRARTTPAWNTREATAKRYDNAFQVIDRCGSCLEDLRVDVFDASKPGVQHFLIDGVVV